MKLGVKEILAVLLAVLASIGIFGMLTAEDLVDPSKTFELILQGLMNYSWAFGWTLALVAVALILLGWEDKVSTDPDRDE